MLNEMLSHASQAVRLGCVRECVQTDSCEMPPTGTAGRRPSTWYVVAPGPQGIPCPGKVPPPPGLLVRAGLPKQLGVPSEHLCMQQVVQSLRWHTYRLHRGKTHAEATRGALWISYSTVCTVLWAKTRPHGHQGLMP